MKISELTPELQKKVVMRILSLPDKDRCGAPLERLCAIVTYQMAENKPQLKMRDGEAWYDVKDFMEAVIEAGGNYDAFHACIEHGFYVCGQAEGGGE